MITLQIPQFDEFNNLKFIGYKKIKVKNKINTEDYNKITSSLVGIPCGYCSEIYNIAITKKPIEIIDFYDIRQRNIDKLRNYFITLLN